MQRPLPVKMREAVDLGGRQRGRIAGDPLVEPGRRRHQRALVGGERLGDGVGRDAAGSAGKACANGAHVARRAARSASTALSSVEPISSGCSTGSAPGPRGSTARPSHISSGLQATFHSVGVWRTSGLPGHALAGRLAVGEGELGVVAGGAGDGAGGRTAPGPRTAACRARPWPASAGLSAGVGTNVGPRELAPSARRAGRRLLRSAPAISATRTANPSGSQNALLPVADRIPLALTGRG